MKVLRLGLGAALIVGIVLVSFAVFLEKSKETKDSSVAVGAPTKDVYLTPHTVSSNDGLDDTPKTMITGTTDVPLYPDARQVETGVEPGKGDYYDKPGGGEYRFWSDSSVDKVVSFYKRELAKSGWTVEEDTRSTPPTAPMASIDFVWVNPVKEVPIRRYLALWVNGWISGCQVWLRFERWPDPEYVPLYPDAKQVQVAWVRNAELDKIAPELDNAQRVTTYKTKASVGEIEAYYNDVMVQHGWEMGRSEPPNHLFFSYRHDTSCPPGSHATWCGTGSLVDVFIYPQEDGTKIELRADEY